MDVDWLSVEMVVRDVVVKSVLKGRAYCEGNLGKFPRGNTS